MSKLKVRYVGPIKEGYTSDDGFIDFVDGVTVFIGNQGSGKSTIAKIFSTLSWLEKALVRGDFKPDYLCKFKRFQKHLSYQNIGNYLEERSEIQFLGKAYKIHYFQSKLTVENSEPPADITERYLFPKIMYIPAERNFVSSVDKPDLVKRLPSPLSTFLDEYEQAKKNLKSEINLPLGDVAFSYKNQTGRSWLIGEDYKIDLLEASSGYQSLVPLFLVMDRISKVLYEKEDFSQSAISQKEKERIRNEIDRILRDPELPRPLRDLLIERASTFLKYIVAVNIVEEPEQNLYPTSQKQMLWSLLGYLKKIGGNKLVLTTHSPYLINYLTLAVKADKLYSRATEDGALQKIKKIVPLNITLQSSELNIYELSSSGEISKLPDYKGIPSDENFLNNELGDFNDSYAKLLEIEEEYGN